MAKIWILTGHKTGDNAQVLRAAAAMGLPFAVKRLLPRPGEETAKPRVEPSLHMVDAARSDPLSPPWPDLVITIGRSLSLAALWIRQQSGGKTRLALFNAPKGHREAFDLIVVPAYYTIADGPKVCRIGLPLIAADPERLAAAKEAFAPTFAALQRPLHVLLLGGDMGQRKLDPAFALSTLTTMQQGFAKDGTIYVSTSRRTPTAAAEAIAAALRPQDRLYRWSPDAAANPYLGLLAHGDSFTVTADSLSMLTEVVRLGKPLAIAEPPEQLSWLARLGRLVGATAARDLGEAAGFLIRGGHATKLGMGDPVAGPLPADDTERVAARLRALATGSD